MHGETFMLHRQQETAQSGIQFACERPIRLIGLDAKPLDAKPPSNLEGRQAVNSAEFRDRLIKRVKVLVRQL
jgi:hypothetical protein